MTTAVGDQAGQEKSRPVWATLLTLIICGPAGVMLILGRGKWAIAYFLLQLVLGFTALLLNARYEMLAWLSEVSFQPHGAAQIPLYFAALFHALAIRRSAFQRPWYSRWYAMIGLSVGFPFLVAGLVRTFLFQPFNIPANSMAPTLVVGDYFFVSKWVYGYSRYSFPFDLASFQGRTSDVRPSRGDVVVFRAKVGVDYIKRVVGLSGDRVQMIDGRLHLNGSPVDLAPESPNGHHCPPQTPRCTFYRETLPGGRSYVIIDLDPRSVPDNTSEVTVPQGHYFVLGDNRDNSTDSRFLNIIGPVPEEDLIGPVVLIFWNEQGLSIRGREF